MPVSWCSSFLTRFLAVSGWNPPHDHPLIFDQVGIVPCDHVMMVIRLKQWFFGEKKTTTTSHGTFGISIHFPLRMFIYPWFNIGCWGGYWIRGPPCVHGWNMVKPQQAAIWAPWPSKAPWANSRINSSKSFCTCAMPRLLRFMWCFQKRGFLTNSSARWGTCFQTMWVARATVGRPIGRPLRKTAGIPNESGTKSYQPAHDSW